MITRRRLFQSGLFAFFASLLPGKSKADDGHLNIKCGDQMQVIGGDSDPFEGVVTEINIREELRGKGFISYQLIAVDCFPPKLNPLNGRTKYVYFLNGRWTDGIYGKSIGVKKLG